MERQLKQQWMEEEIQSFLALWSLEEVKEKLDQALRRYWGRGRPKWNWHTDILNSVLGDLPANRASGALNSATAAAELLLVDSLKTTAADPSASLYLQVVWLLLS